MQAEAARLMVEVAISRGIKEIRRGDCRRALRSILEDAQRYIRRGYPCGLVAACQEMLRAEKHPYYELFSSLADRLDRRYLTGFLMNLCYEGWIRGTRTLRQQQRRLGRRIPWIIHLEVDGLGLERTSQLMAQGTALGVMCYVLHTKLVPAQTLRALCATFPRCALALFAPDDALTAPVLDALEGTDNLLLVAARGEGAFRSAQLMRERKRLYALCRTVDEAAIRCLMATGDLSCPGDDGCSFPMLLAHRSVSGETRRRLNDFVEQLRRRPRQALFPVDIGLDLSRVDALISGGAPALMVDGNGEFRTGAEQEATGAFFPQSTLEELLAAY